ncbi:unnamed protein product [Spirodela intermedia]|uniref:Uncharacterized protein n=1 Tax=Spirodela intermedia TaxID=51605 RepID=A0A7I8ID75_SPIIN|nr:unnamed protein product [Spirodela intermedia]CAA6655777.1 unnamed protein product [Spirodela intermedia]
MLATGNLPNNYTFSFVLRACLHLSALADGRKLHAQIAKLGWESYDFVQNELIHMYATCGCVDSARRVFDQSLHRDVISWTAMVHGYAVSARIEEARELFDKMPERNAVSWSAMMTGYVQAEMFREALALFTEMQRAGTQPNHAGVVGALTACAFLGALDQGRWIHAYVERKKMELDRILGTALIDMYAKCGCIQTALQRQANEITFICVLTSCSRVGLVAEGKNIFDSMSTAHGIEPGVEHYGCLVDLLGRSGLLAEAATTVREMPMEPDAYVLGALLNSCRIHGNVELAKETVESLEELGLDHGGVYVLLSNMYASANRWQHVAEVRKGMESKRVRKVPGCSMIEVDGVACEFVAGDSAHHLNDEILSTLKIMDTQLKVSSAEGGAEIAESWRELVNKPID